MRRNEDLRSASREKCVPITSANSNVDFERFFTPAELAEILKRHPATIRRTFQDKPGVLKIGKSSRRDGKRDYVTLRIPESVVRRAFAEWSK